jgi:hypothetical protein
LQLQQVTSGAFLMFFMHPKRWLVTKRKVDERLLVDEMTLADESEEGLDETQVEEEAIEEKFEENLIVQKTIINLI